MGFIPEPVREAMSRATEKGHNAWEQSKVRYGELSEILHADLRGWLICLAVLVITVVRNGITYSFGMFVVKLEQEFPEMTMAEQNWIGTLAFCISLICAPLSVGFIRAFGHRGFRISGLMGTGILTISNLGSSFVQTPEWLFLTHSIMYGIGSSLIYMASSLVIGDYFQQDHKYHVLATSILLCGYPIGSLLFNPINAWLLDKFDFRVAFRCAAVVVLITGVICCWNFSARQDAMSSELRAASGGDCESEFDDEEGGVESAYGGQGGGHDSGKTIRQCCTVADIRRRPEIVLWNIGNCLSYLGFYMPFVNLGYYMELKHFVLQQSSFALTLLSMAEFITYIIASFLGDYLKDRLVYVNIVSSSCLAVICIVWPLIDVTYVLILAFSIGMGGFLGLNIVYTYAASGEVTQLPIDVAWACTNLWSGFGILLGPFFTGAIYDINKSYTDVFLVVGGVYIVATIVFACIPVVQYFRDQSMPANDMNGATKFETFRISTKRTSRSSLANGVESSTTPGTSVNAAEMLTGTAVNAYGSISTSSVGMPSYEYGSGETGAEWDGGHPEQMTYTSPYDSLK